MTNGMSVTEPQDASSARTNLLQSKYFSPVFNTAIFDGPLRLYFAHHQEQDALRLYFRLQDFLTRHDFQESFEFKSSHLFILLYPEQQLFEQCFEKTQAYQAIPFGDHTVMGLFGSMSEDYIESIAQVIQSHLGVLNAASA